MQRRRRGAGELRYWCLTHPVSVSHPSRPLGKLALRQSGDRCSTPVPGAPAVPLFYFSYEEPWRKEPRCVVQGAKLDPGPTDAPNLHQRGCAAPPLPILAFTSGTALRWSAGVRRRRLARTGGGRRARRRERGRAGARASVHAAPGRCPARAPPAPPGVVRRIARPLEASCSPAWAERVSI
jgi:hypothetical protein